MRAEFARRDRPGDVVGRARWSPHGVEVDAQDPALKAALGRIFRLSPVAVDDPSLRTPGTSGPVVFQPGTWQWFATAARMRSEDEDLIVSFVWNDEGRGLGWDPAGSYRSFPSVVDRWGRGSRPPA